jgi:hypothetical protein
VAETANPHEIGGVTSVYCCLGHGCRDGGLSTISAGVFKCGVLRELYCDALVVW